MGFLNLVVYKRQWRGPGRAGNLCCLTVALADLAFFPLRVRISHKEPQQKSMCHISNILSHGFLRCLSSQGVPGRASERGVQEARRTLARQVLGQAKFF